jgi:3-hydroxymyristoyl/3-hydroxydecanoyl-(acyl carrier protein) dehydratase
VEGAPFEMQAGASCEAQYLVTPESWYFAQNRQVALPYSVLLEIALQPCGWLAAFVGSALQSKEDVCFRNLGGEATQRAEVHAGDLLTTRVKLTAVSHSLGMIIQHYSLEMLSDRAGTVYEGTTYFGFFSENALADQVGITEAGLNSSPSCPSPDLGAMPQHAPFPDAQMRMVDKIESYDPQGGAHGLGFIRGHIDVDKDAWFFKAHFYQDPVWPGSLGLEAFLQLVKTIAVQRWDLGQSARFATMPLGHAHKWTYRGQVLPTDKRVTVEATIDAVEGQTLIASGFLSVDGRIIYQIDRLGLEVIS